MAAPKKHEIEITVNGTKYQLWVEPRRLLVDVIREDLGLTGTHIGCEHGVCGCCTIVMDGVSVNSCLIFAVQADGSEITTVEALSETERGELLQKSFQEHHALQCGFCTPGILMDAYDYLGENPQPTRKEIKEALSGHICRCTGYEPIVEAVEAVKESYKKYVSPKGKQGGSE